MPSNNNTRDFQMAVHRTAQELPYDRRLSRDCMGLAGETGELVDAVKKHIYQGKMLDHEHLKEEIGDILWHLAELANLFNYDLAKIMDANTEKLRKRYPRGFTEKDARERRDRGPVDARERKDRK